MLGLRLSLIALRQALQRLLVDFVNSVLTIEGVGSQVITIRVLGYPDSRVEPLPLPPRP
ncbi:MAG: hypothetical protein ACO2O2_08190 [Acidilobaceae archaeon]